MKMARANEIAIQANPFSSVTCPRPLLVIHSESSPTVHNKEPIPKYIVPVAPAYAKKFTNNVSSEMLPTEPPIKVAMYRARNVVPTNTVKYAMYRLVLKKTPRPEKNGTGKEQPPF
jgi:hypothetical protein